MAPSKSALKAANFKSAAAKKEEAVIERVSKHAREKIETTFKDSPVFSGVSTRLHSFPKFSSTELSKGRVLGRGQFGIVKEIAQVQLALDDEKSTSALITNGLQLSDLNHDTGKRHLEKMELEKRKFIADHCIRQGKYSRYAIKRLSDEVVDDVDAFYTAAKDLALETYILSTLEHPNIIKMRGMAVEDICSPNYFIVMDRLYDTLESRIVRWRKKYARCSGIKGNFFDPRGKKKRKLLDDRLSVAFDLSAALEYLHSLNIMHRDLKPDNIGFDVRGDVTIFDFGLAKELRKENKVENGLFKLTGCTGSMRYMAPEVYREQPYNHSADVYSFALLFWEILYLQTPFQGYTRNMLASQVYERGCRPKVKKEATSLKLILLMTRCWAESSDERLSANDCTNILKSELANIRNEEEANILTVSHMVRKSTYIIPRGSPIENFSRSTRRVVQS